MNKSVTGKMPSGQGQIVDYFLGHSAKSVAKAHYAPESKKRFFQACDWLREIVLHRTGRSER